MKMKTLLKLFMILLATTAFAQNFSVKVDVVKYKVATTTERDAFSVPANEVWKLYNTTDGEWQYSVGGSPWQTFTGASYTFNSPLSETGGVVSLGGIPTTNISTLIQNGVSEANVQLELEKLNGLNHIDDQNALEVNHTLTGQSVISDDGSVQLALLEIDQALSAYSNALATLPINSATSIVEKNVTDGLLVYSLPLTSNTVTVEQMDLDYTGNKSYVILLKNATGETMTVQAGSGVTLTTIVTTSTDAFALISYSDDVWQPYTDPNSAGDPAYLSSETTTITGTALAVDENIKGTIANSVTPSTADDFTVSAIKTGGYVENYINTTGDTAFPTLTNSFGAETLTQSNTFRAGAIFKMIVKAINATDVEYYFLDYLNNSSGASLPAPYLFDITPASHSPSTTVDVDIYSDYLTSGTTATIESQTVNSTSYMLDTNKVPFIRLGVTIGATDDTAFDITLDNGSSTVFTDAFVVGVPSNSTIPASGDWTTTGSTDVATTGEVRITALNTVGTAKWDREIDWTIDWTLDFNLQKSASYGYADNTGGNILTLEDVSDDGVSFTMSMQGFGTSNDVLRFKTSTPEQADTITESEDAASTQEATFDLQAAKALQVSWVSGVLTFKVDGVIVDTLTESFDENMKAKFYIQHWDIANISITEL